MSILSTLYRITDSCCQIAVRLSVDSPLCLAWRAAQLGAARGTHRPLGPIPTDSAIVGPKRASVERER